MALFDESVRKQIKDLIGDLEGAVNILYFTQEFECPFCQQTRQLLTEVAELSEEISLEVYNFQVDKAKVKQYGVDKIPAAVIEGVKDYGVRYYGAPIGYEFATLLSDMVSVSKGETDLKPATKEALAKLDRNVHLQVFVSPT